MQGCIQASDWGRSKEKIFQIKCDKPSLKPLDYIKHKYSSYFMTQLPKIEYLRQYFVHEFQDDKGCNRVLFTF